MEQLAKVYEARRNALLEKMEAGSMLLIYSGETVPCSLDEGYAFEANRNIFYLTGLRRENMALALVKAGSEDYKDHVVLFIEEAVPSAPPMRMAYSNSACA